MQRLVSHFIVVVRSFLALYQRLSKQRLHLKVVDKLVNAHPFTSESLCVRVPFTQAHRVFLCVSTLYYDRPARTERPAVHRFSNIQKFCLGYTGAFLGPQLP